MVANVNDCNSSDAVLVLDEHVIVKFICDRYAYVTGVYKILDSLRIFSRGKFYRKHLSRISVARISGDQGSLIYLLYMICCCVNQFIHIS